MKPQDLIRARVDKDKGTVTLTGKDGQNFMISLACIGSNMPNNGEDERATNSITFVPPANRPGLIAIHVRLASLRDKHSYESCGLFILVTNKEGRIFVELEEEWIPSRDRLGHISYDALVVEIDGVRYASRRESTRIHATDHIVSGELICRYLIGEIDAEELKAEATTVEEEIVAREKLPKVEQELKTVSRWHEEARAQFDELSKDFVVLRQRAAEDFKFVQEKLDNLNLKTNRIILYFKTMPRPIQWLFRIMFPELFMAINDLSNF